MEGSRSIDKYFIRLRENDSLGFLLKKVVGSKWAMISLWCCSRVDDVEGYMVEGCCEEKCCRRKIKEC